MKKKEVFDLILRTSGFELRNYEVIRNGSLRGYQFEAYLNGNCEFQVASDSFESAISDTLEGIYGITDVNFNAINN